MEWRTEVPHAKGLTEISHEQTILAVGSCFAEEIGKKLLRYRFRIDINPYGILYNPASISECLENLVEGKVYSEDDLIQDQGLWKSLSHHSSFAHTDKKGALDLMNTRAKDAYQRMREAGHLMITLGNSWVFRYLPSGKIAGNCHKIPADQFRQERLSVEECVEKLRRAIGKVRDLNPTVKVILTISPVRYLKHGFAGNQAGKAVLILAVEELVKTIPGVHYFPAYEYIMDDLRDYRFYASDLIHPGANAVDYIWEKFSLSFFSEQTRAANSQLESLLLDSEHRFLFPESEQAKAHRQRLLERIAAFRKSYPLIDPGLE
jgi:hypothetical protein